MTLLLKSDEIAPLLDLPKAIALTEDVLAEQSRGAVGGHAPFHLHVEDGGALRVVSGALLETQTMGVRLGPAMTLSGSNALVAVIYDTKGDLLSIMGYPGAFATLRTGATVAVAVKHMARVDAKRVGMIGTGRNALSLLRGVAAVRAVEGIFIHSRDPERRRKFCEDAARDLGLPVTPVEEPRQAVAGMDIVLTASSAREPLFPPDWIEPGMHLTSMGPIGEIDTEMFVNADHVVVSCKEYERDYYDPRPPFPLVELIEAGRMRWDDIAELGDLITGRAAIGCGLDAVTVFHESAGGYGDVAFATWAYREAARLGLGQQISL